MRKIALVMLFVMLMLLPARAQDGSRLRQPTLEDYLRFASENLSCRWEPGDSSSISAWDLCGFLSSSIEPLDSAALNSLPYDVLIGAYDALQPGTTWDAPGNTAVWHEALVTAWIRDQAVDLDTQREFSFAHLTVSVEPRDFNADGADDYLLHVEGWPFAGYFVFMRGADGTVQPVPGWLPSTDMARQSWDVETSDLYDVAFEDVNADGTPEWFLAYGGAGYRGDDQSRMYLFGWRDGGLRLLTEYPLGFVPPAASSVADLVERAIPEVFAFKNLDGDAALELQVTEVSSDNWRCQEVTTRIFDWDGASGLYGQISDGTQRHDSANCVMAPAENALYRLEYTTARYLYQYGLTLPPEPDTTYDSALFEAEMRQFMRLRTAQTLLLSGDDAGANSLLDELAAQGMISGMLRSMREVLTAHRHATPGETCAALFNLFEAAGENSLFYGDFQENIRTRLIVGVAGKYFGDFIGAGNPVDTALAGCNVPEIINSFLKRGYQFDKTAPVEQLAGSGLPVAGHIQADFDGDGNMDWLAWYEAENVAAVLMMDHGDGTPLALSRVLIDRPGEYVTLETVPLPDSAGTGLVLFKAREGLPSYYGGEPCADSSAPGQMELWRYAEDTLHYLSSTTWCGGHPALETMFAEAAANTSGTYVPGPEPSNEALYRDDSDLRYYTRLDGQVRDAAGVDEAIGILDAEIDAPYMDYPFPLLFWKAAILREAGRDAEAFAGFVALVDAAPESLWGKLAALYIEPIDVFIPRADAARMPLKTRGDPLPRTRASAARY